MIGLSNIMDSAQEYVGDGFSFDLVRRNELLKKTLGTEDKTSIPRERKTGTTICGLVYKDGVVLGADTRATAGPTVFDKNCLKIHYIADNIYCCGAGTSADTEQVTRTISSQLELMKMETGTQNRLAECVRLTSQHLFRYQGYVSAALVLGGVDFTGPHIYHLYPHGSAQELPYSTMGSGSLAAMSVFETEWRPDLSEDEAVRIVHKAIRYGIFNDLGSGGNVDICVIKNEGERTRGVIHRTYEEANPRQIWKEKPYIIGPTAVIDEKVREVRRHIDIVDVDEDGVEMEE